MAHSTVLITGASAGIGRALTEQFARAGYDLVLVARRADTLEALAASLGRTYPVHARVVALDLAERDAPRRIQEALTAANVHVDVVVNNAGFGLQGRFVDLPLDRQIHMIQVNVAALTELTHRFLPGMVRRNSGGVLNIASTAAFQPGPLMAVYYATKAYVLSFTEAIAEEVAGSALRVSCLAPGPTATEFAGTAGMTESRIFKAGAMDAAQVARIGYESWAAGKVLVIPGLANRLGVFSVRVAPRVAARRIAKRINSVDAG